ncbi:MAG: TrkH family potassium uptake protein [archaeon]
MRAKITPEFASTVLHYLGIILLVVGNLILLPVILAVYYGEPFLPYVIASVISLSFGFTLFKRYQRGHLTLGRAMVLGASAFAIMALVGAAPYYMLSPQLYGGLGADAFVNSYFESMSGFTTTGLSTLPDIEAVPLSLLFWRSLTQWIGGIGVVVLFLTVMVGPGMSASYLFRGEAREERLEPSVHHTVRNMAKIYLLYTAVGALILYLLGMPLYDAINHVFTVVSTGGFSIKAVSIGAYSSVGIEIAIMALMLVGSIPFILHYKLLGWKWQELRGFAKSREVQALLVIFIVFTGILALYLQGQGDPEPLRHSAFQVMSASTTTGYATMDIALADDFVKSVMIVLMLIGGSAGSTAGGLKIIRLLMLLSSVPWIINKFLLPKTSVLPLKVGKKVFSEEEANQVSWYFFIYMLFIIVGTLIITAYGFSFIDSLFETTSAAATVGLSTGITSATAPMLIKIVLIFQMWIGRLEILPVLVWIGATIGSHKWSRFYN